MKNNQKVFSVTDVSNECYTFHTDREFNFHIWRNATTAYHSHENYVEIFVVLKGSISNTMLGQTTVLTTGDIGLVSPGIPHIHNSINDEEVQLLNLTCNIQTAQAIFSNIYHHAIPETSIKKLQSKDLKIVKNFRDMIVAATNDADFNALVATACVYLLGIFKTLKPPHTTIPQPFQAFINQLQTLDFEHLQIKDLYEMSGYTQRTLSNYFKLYMNKTLVQYVTEIKLNQAKNLLRTTDLSITEISCKLGFDSLSHFNRLFKANFNITPKEYRKQLPIN